MEDFREGFTSVIAALTSAAKQVGVIVHGDGINVQAWVDEAEMDGMIPVDMGDYTCLYVIK